MNTNSLASKRTVNETVQLVKDTPSSIFTKDDVLNLLGSIQIENETGSVTKDQIVELLDSIEGRLSDIDPSDLIDTNTAEFSLNGNEIELMGVEIDTNGIFDEIEHAVNRWFDDLKA